MQVQARYRDDRGTEGYKLTGPEGSKCTNCMRTWSRWRPLGFAGELEDALCPGEGELFALWLAGDLGDPLCPGEGE